MMITLSREDLSELRKIENIRRLNIDDGKVLGKVLEK